MAQRPAGGREPGKVVSDGLGPVRHIEVDPERIVKWVNGFADRHGELHGIAGVSAWSAAHSSVVLTAADGATAVLEPFGPAGSDSASTGSASVSTRSASASTGSVSNSTGSASAPAADADSATAAGVDAGESGVLDGLAAWAMPPLGLGLILVRRGGYAVGLGHGTELISHKVGTRYVQSRTAAGGWSQHRFARRRDNQADALVVSVIEHARRVVLASPTSALIVGGDRSLVRDVLADPRLSRLAKLPRRELFDLPDPRLAVLRQALRRGRAVRILLSEPEATPGPV